MPMTNVLTSEILDKEDLANYQEHVQELKETKQIDAVMSLFNITIFFDGESYIGASLQFTTPVKGSDGTTNGVYSSVFAFVQADDEWTTTIHANLMDMYRKLRGFCMHPIACLYTMQAEKKWICMHPFQLDLEAVSK